MKIRKSLYAWLVLLALIPTSCGSSTSSTSQHPAIFKLSAQGAAAPLVAAKGTPFVAPDGVAATGSSVVYVSDRSASGSDMGKVFKIENGKISVFVDRVRTGSPAGIALTNDQSILLVSALQLNSPTTRCYS